MLAGEAVNDLSVELGISGVTLYKWRRQALIDSGRRPGLKSYEADPLLAARRRVIELEAELKAVKAASALFEEGPLTQKEVPGCPRVEQPGRQFRADAPNQLSLTDITEQPTAEGKLYCCVVLDP